MAGGYNSLIGHSTLPLIAIAYDVIVMHCNHLTCIQGQVLSSLIEEVTIWECALVQ